MKILEGWNGYLQTDGLAAYNKAGKQPGIIRVGCWGHTRRKFIEASGGPKALPGGLSDEALVLIGKLFEIEEQLRKKYLDNKQEFVKERRCLVEPVFAELRAWLDEYILKVPPQSLLGIAIDYMNNQWDMSIRYIKHADIHPDNNIVENAIRPFVIGRKNWLFADTLIGAHASATLYTFIEGAKANGLEPYAYLNYIFKVLPVTPPESLKNLLPYRIDPKILKP